MERKRTTSVEVMVETDEVILQPIVNTGLPDSVGTRQEQETSGQAEGVAATGKLQGLTKAKRKTS